MRTCITCDGPIVGRRSDAIFCSKRCKAADENARRIADGRLASQRRKSYEKLGPRTGNRARYPEAYEAAEARRRARKAGVQFTPVARREIFERDQWTCGICHDAIDPALKHPHPLSATLDHIVPLSKGGAHVSANLQAAHLRCNTRRGTRDLAAARADAEQRRGATAA